MKMRQNRNRFENNTLLFLTNLKILLDKQIIYTNKNRQTFNFSKKEHQKNIFFVKKKVFI